MKLVNIALVLNPMHLFIHSGLFWLQLFLSVLQIIVNSHEQRVSLGLPNSLHYPGEAQHHPRQI